jgi:hypothetical protein
MNRATARLIARPVVYAGVLSLLVLLAASAFLAYERTGMYSGLLDRLYFQGCLLAIVALLVFTINARMKRKSWGMALAEGFFGAAIVGCGFCGSVWAISVGEDNWPACAVAVGASLGVIAGAIDTWMRHHSNVWGR